MNTVTIDESFWSLFRGTYRMYRYCWTRSADGTITLETK
jgi:hypothetical protein